MKMHRGRKAAALTLAVVGLACSEAPTAPVDVPEPSFDDAGFSSSVNLAGGGRLNVTAPPLAVGEAKFEFAIRQLGTEPPTGYFRMTRPRAGFVVDFKGVVTCIATDPANGRAWVGGVVTENNSNDPNHSLAIHQPGRDVWFRIFDGGEGEGAPADRSSVYGFEGAAGIITSAEYCAAQLWPDGNANAFELTRGNIQVRVR